MRAAGRPVQSRGGGFRYRILHVQTAFGKGAVYSATGILVLLNALFMYSFVVNFFLSGVDVSRERRGMEQEEVEGRRTIRVEVLNGAGIPGIARSMTDFLRRQGFDVIDFGNAERFNFYETIVLDRSGDRVAAERVAETVRTNNIVEQKNPFLILDVTLILGRDYRTLVPFRHERRYE